MNTELIQKVNQYITDNGNGLITGPILNQMKPQHHSDDKIQAVGRGIAGGLLKVSGK